VGGRLGLRSAIAHPIQGLIKYHGLKDRRLRLPYHDSISVCTAPLYTHTTFQFTSRQTGVSVDERRLSGHELERVDAVVAAVKKMARIKENYRVVSKNSFPSNIGLGASSSGFAALAVAASLEAGLSLTRKELSTIARLGAGSASRSLTGFFSQWRRGHDHPSSYSQVLGKEPDMGMVVALIPAYKRTEDVHEDVKSSPFFQARNKYVPHAIREMKRAIGERDISKIGRLAELDSLMIHVIAMTGKKEMILWKPETLKIFAEVKHMREEGIEAFFSVDTGATVYINTYKENVSTVDKRIRELGIETIVCNVGGGAREIGEHLMR